MLLVQARGWGASATAAVTALLMVAVWATGARCETPLSGTEPRVGPSPAREVRLASYTAPGDCPPAIEFQQRVRERLPSARFGSVDNRAHELHVVVQRDVDSILTGRVSLGAGGSTGRHLTAREIRGEACSEVIAGLALIAALAIDPMHARPPKETPGRASGAPLADSEVSPTDAVDTQPLLGSNAFRSAPLASAHPTLAVDSSAPSATSLHGSLAAYGGGALGRMPALVPLVGLQIDTSWESSFWPWSFIAAFEVVPTTTNVANIGRLKHSAQAARLDVCPVHWRIVPQLTLRTCAGLQAGVLQVEGGSGIENSLELRAKSQTAVWLAAEESLRLRLSVGGLHLELRAELVQPMKPYEYVYDFGQSPSQSAYKMAPTGFVAGVGLGTTVF